MVSAPVIGVGAYVAWESNVYHNGHSNLNIEGMRLTQIHESAEFNVVQGEIAFTVDRPVYLSLGGDLVEKRLGYNNKQNWLEAEQSGDGYMLVYSGPLLLAESKAVGDEVHILIRHGGSQTEVVAEVEGT